MDKIQESIAANAAYHAKESLSSSQVGDYLEDPVEWYHVWKLKDWKKPEPTPAMQFGTTIHRMCELGGWDGLCKEIPADVLNKDGHCKGELWTQWKLANPCDVYLKPGEPNALRTIWENLMGNKFCRRLIEQGQKEVEIEWYDDDLGCECRCKADVVLDSMVVDWKSTCKKTTRAFKNEILDRFYDVRLALYRRGFAYKYGESFDFFAVAMRTSGGMQIKPYQFEKAWLDDAEARLILAVDEMQHFDLAKYLDQEPEVLEQPQYSRLELDSIE